MVWQGLADRNASHSVHYRQHRLSEDSAMKNDREPGYYWVRLGLGDDPWVIMELNCADQWLLPGVENAFEPDECEIGPRINRPGELK
jgi:hypothetical protein